MPFINFKGFDRDQIEPITQELVDKLSVILNAPKENIAVTIETKECLLFGNGHVEFRLLNRPKEMLDEAAKCLSDLLGLPGVKIYFDLLERKQLYINEKPLA